MKHPSQEDYRLPNGSAVRLSVNQSKLNGRIGHITSMYFVGSNLMAWVEVDSAAPDDPVRSVPARFRSIDSMPQTLIVRADSLQPVQPEFDLIP